MNELRDNNNVLKVDKSKLQAAMPFMKKLLQTTGSLDLSSLSSLLKVKQSDIKIHEDTENQKNNQRISYKPQVTSEKRKFLVIENHVHIIKEFALVDEFLFPCQSKYLPIKVKIHHKQPDNTTQQVVTIVYMDPFDSELHTDQSQSDVCAYVKR